MWAGQWSHVTKAMLGTGMNREASTIALLFIALGSTTAVKQHIKDNQLGLTHADPTFSRLLMRGLMNIGEAHKRLDQSTKPA